eukprot:763703-Hanusia_phi.AAC.2
MRSTSRQKTRKRGGGRQPSTWVLFSSSLLPSTSAPSPTYTQDPSCSPPCSACSCLTDCSPLPPPRVSSISSWFCSFTSCPWARSRRPWCSCLPVCLAEVLKLPMQIFPVVWFVLDEVLWVRGRQTKVVVFGGVDDDGDHREDCGDDDDYDHDDIEDDDQREWN